MDWGLSTLGKASLAKAKAGIGVERRRIRASAVPLDQRRGADHRRVVGAELWRRDDQPGQRSKPLLRSLPQTAVSGYAAADDDSWSLRNAPPLPSPGGGEYERGLDAL